MKNIFYILVFTGITTCAAMEKPGLLQMYKNWAYARSLTHFTQRGQEYDSDSRPGQYIPLKELHTELDRQVRRHLLINYVLPPVIGAASAITVAGLLVYKNL